MIATGLALMLFGFCGANMFPPSRYGFDWRDFISGIPLVLGFLLTAVGIILWAWRNLP